jgi:hypothetical protein
MYGQITRIVKLQNGQLCVYASIDVDGVEEEASMEFDKLPHPAKHNVEYRFHGVVYVGGGYDGWRFLTYVPSDRV